MAREITIGGRRLGSGNKMKTEMHGFERSSHNTGFLWQSSMSAGTLVPFMSELILPGDTFDIDLNMDCMTHPTIGPLFGHYKIQLDVFQGPLRLYNPRLQMNMVNIGMDMSEIKLPQILIEGPDPDPERPISNQQIHTSCIFSYLGIRGAGHSEATP